MRSLIFSVALMVFACSSDYKLMTQGPVDMPCVEKNFPRVPRRSWFDAAIDVEGRHVSGLLFIKNVPDSASRVVFTTEAGVKLLDFEWKTDGAFKVHHMMSQLRKKAIINLLRKDFELILGLPFRNINWTKWELDNELYYGTRSDDEGNFIIVDDRCTRLIRVESGSSRKRKVTITFEPAGGEDIESIQLHHHTFNLDIRLKRLTRE